MTYTLLLDPGHGKDTPGKRSPILPDRRQLLEWQFSRDLAWEIEAFAINYAFKVVRIVTEDIDIPLSNRAARVNDYIKKHPDEKCVLISLHGNAAGNGGNWMAARGWEAWTTVGKTNSDKLAEELYASAEAIFPTGTKLRTDKSDGDKDKEKNFTVIYKANCPAVLTENFFYDNIYDCEYMLSRQGLRDMAEVHLTAVNRYFFFT